MLNARSWVLRVKSKLVLWLFARLQRVMRSPSSRRTQTDFNIIHSIYLTEPICGHHQTTARMLCNNRSFTQSNRYQSNRKVRHHHRARIVVYILYWFLVRRTSFLCNTHRISPYSRPAGRPCGCAVGNV